MAAGRGIRLKPFTNKFPKGMLPYRDTTLIANGILEIKKYVKNIHISVGHKKADLAKHVIEKNITSIWNTNKKGNAWWIFNTFLKYLNEPIVVLTCDNITKLNLQKVKKDYVKKNHPPCMIIAVKPIKKLSGDYIFQKKNIVTKLSRKKRSKIYCSGIQILNPYLINKLVSKTSDFNDVWKDLIKKKKLFVSDIKPKKWFTVDKIENLSKLMNQT